MGILQSHTVSCTGLGHLTSLKTKVSLSWLSILLNLKRQRLMDLCKFETSLVYIVNFRIARTMERPVSKQTEKKRNKIKVKNISSCSMCLPCFFFPLGFLKVAANNFVLFSHWKMLSQNTNRLYTGTKLFTFLLSMTKELAKTT